MAVYTHLNETDVGVFLQGFGLTRLTGLRGTDAGIENTNYFVDALDSNNQTHALVLTLFERGTVQALPYFVELTTYLGQQALPVPCPYRDRQQQALHTLHGKPCLLVPRFPGHHPLQPNPQQCSEIGNALARMHVASAGFDKQRENDRGALWRDHASVRIAPCLNATDRTLLLQQVQDWKTHLPALAQLPAGITHGDLFHDNALFLDNRLTGIIDFYNACTDIFIFDLAVLVNDWCSRPDFSFDPALRDAVLNSYTAIRPLTAAEQHYWPAILRYAAVRFWLSRLESWHFPASGLQVKQKNPEPMRQLLLQRMGASGAE